MKRKVLVSQLIMGSEKIDLMEKQIKGIIGMITSFAKQSRFEFDSKKELLIFPCHDKSEWRIILDLKHANKRARIILVEYHFKENYGFELAYNSSDHQFSLGYVQSAYENLQVFIDGMYENFPDLNMLLKLFIEASSVNLVKI